MAQRHAKRRLELTLAICSPKSREKGHLCRHRRASARPRARRRRLVSLPTGCVIGAGFQRLWASVYQEGKLAFTQEASAALPGLNLLCFWEKLQETTGRSRSRISVGGYKDEFCVLLGPQEVTVGREGQATMTREIQTLPSGALLCASPMTRVKGPQPPH